MRDTKSNPPARPLGQRSNTLRIIIELIQNKKNPQASQACPQKYAYK